MVTELTFYPFSSPGTVILVNPTRYRYYNFIKDKSDQNRANLDYIIIKVTAFIIGAVSGALLFAEFKFFRVAFFILIVFALSVLVKNIKSLTYKLDIVVALMYKLT